MATTTNYSWNLPTVGGNQDTWGDSLNANWTALDTLLGGVSATELAILDGATVTTAELNILDGVTATTAELNILDGVTASTAEINLLTGATSLGPTAPATTTDGGVAIFSSTDGTSLRDSNDDPGAAYRISFPSSGTIAIGPNTITPSQFDPAQSYTGIWNTVIGVTAGAYLTSGSENAFVGPFSAGSTSNPFTGSRNAFFGHTSGAGGRSGSFGTAIGAFASAPASGSNTTSLGYQAGGSNSPFSFVSNSSASNRVVLGNNDITNAYIKVAWTVTSDERDKTDFAPLTQGLDVVDAIDTFTFKFDNRSSYYVYDDDGNIIDTPTPDGTHKSERTFAGFKAQQVQSVLDAAGFPSDVVVDTEDPENLKMKETALIPLLINAIKELKARVEVLEGGV